MHIMPMGHIETDPSTSRYFVTFSLEYLKGPCLIGFSLSGKVSNRQRGSDFDNVFFLVDEGRDDPNTTISGPTSARQQTPLKWSFTVVPLLALYLVIFRGSGPVLL